MSLSGYVYNICIVTAIVVVHWPVFTDVFYIHIFDRNIFPSDKYSVKYVQKYMKSLCKIVVKHAQSKWRLKWLDNSSHNFPVSNFMKFCLSVLDLFHAYRKMDGLTKLHRCSGGLRMPLHIRTSFGKIFGYRKDELTEQFRITRNFIFHACHIVLTE
jgi:hypothetical protein